MSTATVGILRKELHKLRHQVNLLHPDSPVLEAIQADPAKVLELAGMTPDPWQQIATRSSNRRQLLLCARQSGKSTVAAARALHVALCQPGSLVLLLSPTLRQSGELFRDKIIRLYGALGRPVETTQESALALELANGSRIISLPGEEGTIRGFSSVSLLVIDEAARVPDALYSSVRPMLAVSRGSLVALSTPNGKRGFFHDAWVGNDPWERLCVRAPQCPRISPEFLQEERRCIGPRWFAQEYECEFVDASGAVFASDAVLAMLSNEVQPLALAWSR
jgi:hypothetical protein